jgi:hypothetical protein
MGLFCVNFHFRTNDDKALSAAVKGRGVDRFRILPAKGGWASLYEEQASQQDDERIRELASGLSKQLGVAVIAFLVHDSDIACYWLFEKGKLLDEFNSCPDYFEGGGSGPSGGDPNIFVRYCRKGVRAEEIAEILAGENLFAERVIERLAETLGIDVERALQDYGDGGPDGLDGPGGADDEDDGDGPGGGSGSLLSRAALAGRMAEMFGARPGATPADPQVAALVHAASNDDTSAIDRLLDEGAAIDAEAPCLLAGSQPLAGLGQLFPGGPPKFPMTPLLAAIAHKRHSAVERLLERGADPNRVHPLFGTPLHAAAGAGAADLVKLLIAHGGDASQRNAQ